MNRINTSRQTLSAKQRNGNYRPNNRIAQHILDSTIYDEKLTGQVVNKVAGRNFILNGLKVAKGEKFSLVASKFAHRYYVMSVNGCSSTDARVIAKCRGEVLYANAKVSIGSYTRDGYRVA